MKLITMLLTTLTLLLSSGVASARDDIESYDVESALNNNSARDRLGNEVTFYFGNSKHGRVIKRLNETKTNKKTNAFNKSDEEACQWVFLSAMLALKAKAKSVGANAVINIKSNYKGNMTSSNTTFKCGAGFLMAGVALKGTMVKLKR
jgi:uncharacterized protein YbjQ (UPF0145 family)